MTAEEHGAHAEAGAWVALVHRVVRPWESPVFLFFSNRLGCGGSLILSLALTVFVLLLLYAL